MQQPTESWGSVDAYERFMGRWSRLVAEEFVHWLPVALEKHWLDVGCGTGILSHSILHAKAPKEILAIDSSPAFITFGRQTNQDPRLRFEIAQAESLPVESDSFDVAVAGLVLNFVPQPLKATAEMMRATKPGGTVAAYVWDYAGGMEMVRYFWDAAIALDANAAPLDQGTRSPLARESGLRQLFLDSGLHDVTVRAIEVTRVFSDFNDFWQPFLGGVGAAPSYVAKLSEPQRIALQQRLQATLPQAADGTITLIARAWAAQGIV